jgi:hypothetical protein
MKDVDDDGQVLGPRSLVGHLCLRQTLGSLCSFFFAEHSPLPIFVPSRQDPNQLRHRLQDYACQRGAGHL